MSQLPRPPPSRPRSPSLSPGRNRKPQVPGPTEACGMSWPATYQDQFLSQKPAVARALC